MTDISVVIPVYNEAPNITELVNRVGGVMTASGKSFEIILSDDGSKDGTLEEIKKLSEGNMHLKAVSLSRNFGHQVALTAGMDHAEGSIIITLDGDLQHPPELIPELLKKHGEGYDIVNTIRLETEGTGPIKNLTSKGFYRLINVLSDVEIKAGAADFRLMSRRAADAFLSLKEKDRFTRGLVSWMGFAQTFVPYEADRRFAGKSKYTLRKMIRFALDGLTSFSAKPLRVSLYLGFLFAVFGLFYALYAIINHSSGNTMPGWTSLLIMILLIGGLQLISLGIIGEYLARVYHETKNRPLYFVKETVGKLKTDS
jgi:glycosyltransferase involved in cell wall biosynthesis